MLPAVSGYRYNAMAVYNLRGAASRGVPAARPEAPVAPVDPVKAPLAKAPVTDDTPLNIPELLRRMETDPVENAVRGRIQYGEEPGVQDAASQGQRPGDVKLPGQPDDALKLPGQPEETTPKLPGQKEEQEPGQIDSEKAKSAAEVMEESECQTCKNRRYQDGSDDPGVSFKTPTRVAPEQAASAVRGHENEHVVREQAAAQREGRKVVSQTVTYHNAICPECGRVYVSGGTTRTTTAAMPEVEPEPEEENAAARFFAVA